MKTNKGITLIALIITIIILIILAGIVINLSVGENGIFTKAKYAKEQYQKAQVKEKIELAIADIQTAKIAKGEKCTIDTLISELPSKIENLTIEKDGIGAKGTCEGYKYKIDENQKVTIEGYDTNNTEEESTLTPEGYTKFTVTAENRSMIGYTDETTELVIPDIFEYEGVTYKVVAIGKDIKEEEMENMSEEEATNLMKEIPFMGCTNLTKVTIPDSVTTIGFYAFANCTSLTNITIPNSVTTIGFYAFFCCESLTSVTIPNSVTTIGFYAFFGCESLTSVTIPNSVTTIGDEAFYGCNSLTSIIIPDSVTTIGNGAFYYCHALTSINVDSNNTKYASENGVLFNKEKTELIKYPEGKTDTTYTIPNSVTTIGDEAFCSCDSLTSVTIPNSVTTIGDEAFCSCDSLTSVTISDSVITIGKKGFAFCNSLTSMTIPDSVTTIGDSAFCFCSSLTSVTIPDSVITIGSDVFLYCSSLTSVTIPDSVTTIGNEAFGKCTALTSITVDSNNIKYVSENGILFNKEKTELIQYPAGKTDTTYTIPDSVTTIGNGAFYRCDSLTSITIPDSVTTIRDDAFSRCSKLTSVEISSNVTNIGKKPFTACFLLTNISVDSNNTKYISENGILFNKEKTELIQYPAGKTDTTYTIPDSVTTIEDEAFYWCTKLTSVTIPDSVITIGEEAFYKVPHIYYNGTATGSPWGADAIN